MTSRIRIFICYRKELSYHKNEETFKTENLAAENLHEILRRNEAYEPWLDRADILPGMTWETMIYKEILASDVLLVLIGPGTGESEWVRREIALARALGISIVPIGFNLSEDQLDKETAKLSISDLQWVMVNNIRPSQGDALLANIAKPLREALEATIDRQCTVLGELWKRRNPVKKKAPDNQKKYSYYLFTDEPRVLLHVASGDMMKIKHVDVFVNSENDYMQMARFFESRTISSMLRSRGARVVDGRYEDTIQQELDWHLRDRSRPVYAAEAFATSAGASRSELVRVNKARVIIHIASVQSVDAESRVVPYKEPHKIEKAVQAALTRVAELNEVDGVFSQPDTDQRLDQEVRAKIGNGKLCNIVFPLLGTGQGGAQTAEVIEPIVDGLVGYLSDSDNLNLRRALREVYVSAFSEDDVRVVKAALDKRFECVSSVR